MGNLMIAEKVPAHAKTKGAEGKGNNLSSEAFETPKLRVIATANSGEITQGWPDAKVGMWSNTLSKEIYDEVYVVPINLVESYQAYNNTENNAFWNGATSEFVSKEEAMREVEAAGAKPDEHSLRPFHTHNVLQLDPKTGEIITAARIEFKNTAVGMISKTWNTLIAQKGGDRFSSVWKLGSEKIEKSKSKIWHQATVEYVGFCTDAIYKEAEKFYDAVT